jgi:hypothetical protein
MEGIEPVALMCFLDNVEIISLSLLNRYFQNRFRSRWKRMSLDTHVRSVAQLPTGVTHVTIAPDKFHQLTIAQKQQLISCCILDGDSEYLDLSGLSPQLTQLEIQFSASVDVLPLCQLTNLQKLHFDYPEVSVCDILHLFKNLTDLKLPRCRISDDCRTLPFSLTSLQSDYTTLDVEHILHLAPSLVRLTVLQLLNEKMLVVFTQLTNLAVTSAIHTKLFEPNLLPPHLVYLNYQSGIADGAMFPASLRTIIVQKILDYRSLPAALEQLTLCLNGTFNSLRNLNTFTIHEKSSLFSTRCFHLQNTQLVISLVSCDNKYSDAIPIDIFKNLRRSLHITNYCLVELDHIDLQHLQTVHSLPNTVTKLHIVLSANCGDLPRCPSVTELTFSTYNNNYVSNFSRTFFAGCNNVQSITDNLDCDKWHRVKLPASLRTLRFTSINNLLTFVPRSLYTLTLPTHVFQTCHDAMPTFQFLTYSLSLLSVELTTIFFL